MIEQNTNYAYKLKYMGNPTFDKVRDFATKFYRELPQALQDELFEALNHGIDILDSEPQMTAYLFAFGKMHQAKLEYAFSKLPEDFLELPEINIIDYGCGQALGTMCYADFLRENGYSQKVKTITLIEPSEICIKRAALHALVFFPNAEIKTINKTFNELDENDIYCDEDVPTLHVLSNVLDILDFDLEEFAELIKGQIKGYNQFVCVGPFFGFSGKDNRMKEFCSLLYDHDYFCKSFDKYELNPEKAWTCKLCLFSKGKGFYNGKEISSMNLSRDLFGLIDDIQYGNIKGLPSECQILIDCFTDLVERKKCITVIAEKLHAKGLLNCEEISIVDYECGQGLASICLLGWLRNANYDLSKIKNVKLVDKDRSMLNQASVLFAAVFPSINVVTYEQDILNKDFFIECDSVLTINVFSHILSDISIYDELKRFILKSHSIFVHNIILDEESSKSYPERIKPYYFNYAINHMQDYTGCKVIADEKFIVQNNSPEDKIKLYRYAILSRTSIEEINIPNHKSTFANLCPGEPYREIVNANLLNMWYGRPLQNSKYCESLDDYNMISLEENYISPSHEKSYKKELDELNPHTIKECAEMFYVGFISHALSCGFPCGEEIVSIYQKAAEEGINEANNNLGILFLGGYNRRDNEATKKGIDYLTKASRGGSKYAMINLASYYMSQGNVDMALTYYYEASQKGNPIALYNLAIAVNFGLLNQEIDLVKAEALYKSCLEALAQDPDKNWMDFYIQNVCCLNLMLLLKKKGEHYLKLLDVYYSAEKPSDDLKYCKEILKITYTNRCSKNIDEILHLTKVEEYEKPYVTYNRAQFLYNGLYLESFEIKQDVDSAISILQSLVDEIEGLPWDNKYKYIYPIYASWLNRHRQGFNGQDLVYWEKAAESNPEKACAYLTNCATIASDKERAKKIWQSYAFSYSRGCVSCHECSNYDTTRLTCPKALYVWATKYEEKNKERTTLLHQSAEQEYNSSLFYLGFREAIKKHFPELHENKLFNLIPGIPPKEYEPLYPILARNEFFEYLQKASELNHRVARNIMPFVTVFRNDKYNYLYWLCIFNNSIKHEDTKRNLFEFFKSVCNKTIEKYFVPKTLCEKQILSIAEDISKITEDVQFICTYAAFLLDGDELEKAKEMYELAKEKGCIGIDEILKDVNNRILSKKMNSRTYGHADYSYDDYDWRQDSWDAMTDGMYGDMPDGFDGDFDFLGY